MVASESSGANPTYPIHKQNDFRESFFSALEHDTPEHTWSMPMQRRAFFDDSRERVGSRAISDVFNDRASLDGDKPWWRIVGSRRYEAAKWFDDYSFLRTKVPSEQYIIGSGGDGVRFYNYGEPMSAGVLLECECFVESASVRFGMEQVSSLIGDVVMVGLKHASEDKPKNLGHRDELYKGVVFLSDDFEEYERRDVKLLHVLAHEFGHAFSPRNMEEKRALYSFAQNIGWEMDRVLKEVPDWSESTYDWRASPYSICTPIASERQIGAPTLYAQKNIRESLAETVALDLTGEIDAMPWLVDTLRQYFDDMGVKYNKNPATRSELIIDHRTGDDILYPI